MSGIILDKKVIHLSTVSITTIKLYKSHFHNKTLWKRNRKSYKNTLLNILYLCVVSEE